LTRSRPSARVSSRTPGSVVIEVMRVASPAQLDAYPWQPG
jgi:hypothetical protein